MSKRHLAIATGAEGEPIAAPPVLEGLAMEEWNRVAPDLHARGLLTTGSRGALAAYCRAYERWVNAEQKIAETGDVVKSPSGAPMLNPYLSVSNSAQAQMRTFMREFGMTPSAAKQVATKGKRVKDDLSRAFGA